MYEQFFYSSQIYIYSAPEQENQIQTPGTIFLPIFKLQRRGLSGNFCRARKLLPLCRFATVTGVHQGAHICLAKYWINGKVLS